MYEQRFYRDRMGRDGLVRFEVKVEQSDLLILCDRDLERRATAELHRIRRQIEGRIASDPRFGVALEPCDVDPADPEVVREMARAGRAWDVGPMAAVAGAVAERVGRALAPLSATVIVENGGDVFARSPGPATFALYAGESSPFEDRLRFRVAANDGVGVCTSSGTVGPSLSFGRADAVVAIAGDTAFADAAATALANRVREPEDVDRIVYEEERRGALDGLIACCGDRIGICGAVELVRG
jgi:ApbE superfamily uncharacterized protein (UPF0280 family)